MAHNFGSLVFTPLVKALQEKYGSRRQYARMEAGAGILTAWVLTNRRSLPRGTASIWQRWERPGGHMFSTGAVPKAF